MADGLSWDIILIGGLIVLLSYNYILGQNATVKLIVSLYIAILTADGIVNSIRTYLVDPSPGWNEILGIHKDTVFIVARLLIFLATMVIFVIRGGFHISLTQHNNWVYRLSIHTVFALMASILMISTVLIYMSGASFVEGMIAASANPIHDSSVIARVFLDYYQIWFSLPAIAFLVMSFIETDE